MNYRFRIASVATIIIISALATQEVFAQTPAAPTPAAQTPAPPARKWHGSLAAGLAVASGAQAQRGYQLDANLMRPLSDKGRFVGNFSREYGRVTFPDESLLSDRTAASVGFDYQVSRRTVAMVRSLYLHDEMLHVNSRFEQLAGYGLHLARHDRKVEFYFIPGVSVFKQDLSYSEILDWEVGFGFFQKLSVTLNEAWGLEQSFRFRDNVTDDDRAIESSAQLHGMITKTLGIQLEYQYNLETIVPPGYPSYLQVLSVGLRFKF